MCFLVNNLICGCIYITKLNYALAAKAFLRHINVAILKNSNRVKVNIKDVIFASILKNNLPLGSECPTVNLLSRQACAYSEALRGNNLICLCINVIKSNENALVIVRLNSNNRLLLYYLFSRSNNSLLPHSIKLKWTNDKNLLLCQWLRAVRLQAPTDKPLTLLVSTVDNNRCHPRMLFLVNFNATLFFNIKVGHMAVQSSKQNRQNRSHTENNTASN